RRATEGRAPRTLTEVIELLAPVANALAIAHAENVSHRDIKPGNLFLTRAATGPSVKLLDFGIAKVLSDATSFTQALEHTGSNTRMLTPRYAAPEQFDGRFGATGPWTDVFALALMIIELVSGQPGLSGGTLIELYRSATADERPSLATRGAVESPAV